MPQTARLLSITRRRPHHVVEETLVLERCLTELIFGEPSDSVGQVDLSRQLG